jgi:outer membrane protein OmpA-like peptidoglycan-associated protein
MPRGVKYLALLPLLMAVGTPVGGRVPLSCSPGPFVVFFDRKSAMLDADSRSVLDNAISQRGNCGSSYAYLLGHTDTSEPRIVSRKRAEVVRLYLVKHGFPRSAITIAWRGADTLRVPTPPKTIERQNRRVEITYGPSRLSFNLSK